MPSTWAGLLKGSKISKEDVAKNPETVLNVLEFYSKFNEGNKESSQKAAIKAFASQGNLLNEKKHPLPKSKSEANVKNADDGNMASYMVISSPKIMPPPASIANISRDNVPPPNRPVIVPRPIHTLKSQVILKFNPRVIIEVHLHPH